jgi:hypothetical protein
MLTKHKIQQRTIGDILKCNYNSATTLKICLFHYSFSYSDGSHSAHILKTSRPVSQL